MKQLGIIGAGRIGRVHAESISRMAAAAVKTLADPFMSPEIEKWAAQLGVDKCVKDYKEIIADPAIDGVLICSPTDTHADISLEAIAAGKHVFCEKPVSQKLDEILAVKKALAASPNIKYLVGFNRRFDHNFKAARAAVEQGKVGEQHIVRITSRDPGPPPIEYIKVSGGLFMDMTIHDFDMLRYLTGSEVDEVFVRAANKVDPAIGQAGDIDTAVITLTMKNSVIAIIENSRKAAYGYDQRVEVFGSKGMVSIGNDAPSTAVISTEDGVTGEKPLHFFLERYMDAYVQEARDFVTAIENDTPVPVGIEDGLQSVLIAMACALSHKESRAVKMSEIG
ncbi:MAG: inositol 2-dehydrogenase [Oscillospiraceae bacterium]|nr:inositol 2-dehydrogenase [Oscillospiraceae bacterium]